MSKAEVKKEAVSESKKSGFLYRFGEAQPLILSFFIPFVAMMLIFIIRGIFPFGPRSFLRTDLYHQYAPFYKELLRKLRDGGSLLYTWKIGGGTNFLALFAYYLSSPLNILLLLCSEHYVIEFITYAVVLKISLSGLTMGIYLKKHTGRNDFGIPMFAAFYALSGYIAAYSWNIMWLDCILLFPLIILGLEMMVKENKCLLYVITLALAIITNYYISIMICISLVIYFIMQLVILPGKRRVEMTDANGRKFTRIYYANYPRKILQFAVYSLIAGGIAAVILLPTYYAIMMSASANSTFPKTFTSYFPILQMLNRHLDNVDIHLGLDHWPNIFCSVGIFIFIPLYIMNRRVGAKEKAAYFIALLFYLASFSMNFLNFIWHGFHYPNSLPSRQSFAYIFLLLTMAYEGFSGAKERSIKQIAGAISAAAVAVLLFEALYGEDISWNFPIYYVSLLFIAIYGMVVYAYRRFERASAFLAVIGLVAVFGEGFMNMNVTSVTTISRPDYVEFDKDYLALEKTAAKMSPEIFYRTEKLRLRTKNDGSWYGYQTMSVFSSTANAALSKFYKVLGMESATNAYSKTGATPFIDMLFSVRFELSNIVYDDNEIRTRVASIGKVNMYENTYTLPLGFMVPADMEELWYTGGSNPVDTQNGFISAATDIYNMFRFISTPTSGDSKTIKYTATESGYYCAYTLNSQIDGAKTYLTRNGRDIQSVTHSSLKRRFIMDIGYVQAGDVINITTNDEGQNMLATLYILDAGRMKSAYEKLAAHGLHVTEYTDTMVKGTVNAAEDGLLFTTIAYEDGWSAYLDGKKVDTINFKDAMLAINVPTGDHTVEFRYTPAGFDLGLKLTLASLAALILLTLIKYLLGRFVNFPSPFVDDIYEGEDEAADEDEDSSEDDKKEPGKKEADAEDVAEADEGGEFYDDTEESAEPGAQAAEEGASKETVTDSEAAPAEEVAGAGAAEAAQSADTAQAAEEGSSAKENKKN